jgi:hypothetical protein
LHRLLNLDACGFDLRALSLLCGITDLGLDLLHNHLFDNSFFCFLDHLLIDSGCLLFRFHLWLRGKGLGLRWWKLKVKYLLGEGRQVLLPLCVTGQHDYMLRTSAYHQHWEIVKHLRMHSVGFELVIVIPGTQDVILTHSPAIELVGLTAIWFLKHIRVISLCKNSCCLYLLLIVEKSINKHRLPKETNIGQVILLLLWLFLSLLSRGRLFCCL